MIITPRRRITTLWEELRLICKHQSVAVAALDGGSEFLAGRTETGQILMLMSWTRLLDEIRSDLLDNGERGLAADVDQLLGLCTEMDESGFLPLAQRKLTEATPWRLEQYTHLVDKLVETALADELCTIKGLRAASGRGGYVRHVLMGSIGMYVQVDIVKWHRYRLTPLWIRFWQGTPIIWEALRALEHEDPPRLYSDPETQVPSVPLFLLVGREYEAVVAHLVHQFREIHTHLLPILATTPSHPANMPDIATGIDGLDSHAS
jgi:hypothetical protein